MEEFENMDSDIPLTELEELQCELPEAQDDEDEVEELKNSLREVVQDQSVKPKLQCLIVDPSFSMVTVQSEDSSIIWETASSRCSTPWASDASYSSDTYSIDGSTTCGVQGKINIVFDEERIVRKRKRTRGKSRLGERLRTPRCSRSGSELGVERPEMAEVSVPNIRVECVESDTESGRGKDREQELFSLISESYEILNIKVPSKLQTVDEEESTVLQDNLHYLEETPRIKSKFRCGSQALSAQDCPILVEAPDNTDEQVVKDSQPLKPMDEQGTCIRRDGSRDMEYFEAFTLIDDLIIPGQQDTVTLLEEADTLPLLEEPYLKQKTATDTHDAALLNDFVIVTDMEIASERLDEVFYGNKRHATPNNLMDEKEDKEGAKRGRRESLKSLKESGSALFGSEESILTPIFLSPGPPKIIDPGLLEEPAAMSFLYSDLYEDAKGEKRRSDEEGSEAESVGSDRTLLGHLSDSEETDGYLEKFILKDETPSEVGRSEEADNKGEWLMLWPQTKYELTGFLTRVVEEEERESKVCNLEEVRVAVDLQPSGCEENGSELTKKCPQELHCAFDEAVTDSSTVVISKISDKTKTTEPDRPGTGFIHNLQAKVVPPAPQWPLTPSPSKEGNAKEVPLMKRNTLESEDEWENSHLRKITEMELQPEARVTEGEPHSEISEELEYVMIPQLETTVKLVSETERKHVFKDIESDCNKSQELEEIKANISQSLKIEKEEKERQEKKHHREKLEKESQERYEKESKTREIDQEKLEKDQHEREKEKNMLMEEGKTRQESERQLEIPREKERMKEEKERKEKESKERESDRRKMEKERQEREKETQKLKEEKERNEREKERKDSEREQERLEKEKQEREREKHRLMEEEKRRQEMEKQLEIQREKERMKEEKEREDKESKERERLLELQREKERMKEEKERKESKEKERQLELQREKERMKEEKERQEREREKRRLEEEEKRRQEMERQLEIQRENERMKEEKERKEKESKERERLLELQREKERMKEEKEREEKESKERERLLELQRKKERMKEEKERKENESKERERLLELQREKERMKEEKERKESKEKERQLELQREKERMKEEKERQEREREKHRLMEEEKRRQEMERQLEIQRENERMKEEKERKEKESKERERLLELQREKERMEEEKERKESKEKERQLELQREKERMKEEKERQEREREKHRLMEEKKRRQEMERQLEIQRENERMKEEKEREDKESKERERLLELQREKERMKEEKERQEREKQKLKEEKEREKDRKDREQEQERLDKEKQEREREKHRLEREKETQDLQMMQVESVQEKQRERKNTMLRETEREGAVLDLVAYEDLIEADFEIFDAEEESQARAATALLGMDWFCLCCGCLLSETDKLSGGHKDHKITSIETAFEDIRERLSDWISDLQERSEIIENLVSELELGYNTLEDHCRDSEDGMKAQNEEIVALVVEQYNTMSLCIEEEKKATLEQLYDQIISFQDSIDHAKVTLETTAREAEIDPDQDMQTTKDICMRLKKAQQSAMSLELGPQGLLVFENYAKGNTANKQMQRKGIPVPQKPSLQPQEYGSASSTSVTVYWRVSLGDIIDCFQVYCTEDPQGVSDEYRVTVKESYCVLEELEPDKVYKVWVMAVNYTGCSLPSERLPFRTSPSVPVIDTERCTILWDSATLRWSATNQTQAESYTLEYCRQYALEGEGLRCISGIQGRQQKVLLHPNENYLFYIKAVNKAGASEQSEAALISTRGTRFQLLTRSVHPVLKLSEDQTTIHYPLDTYKQIDEEAKRYLSVLGELLPMKGHHYWETNVTGSPAYRVGVVYGTANGDSPLVENSMSWCLHCVPTPSSCRFELLHGSVQTDVFVVDVPSRIGTLLDFQNGCLSFYNAQSGQLLGTLSHCFTQPCHPILGMEQPGSLKVSMTFKMPDFIKNS